MHKRQLYCCFAWVDFRLGPWRTYEVL